MRCLLLLSLAAVADSVLTEGVIDPNDLMRRTTDDPPRKYLRPRDDMPEVKKKMSRAYGQIKSFKGQYERGQARRHEAIRSREATWHRMLDGSERHDNKEYDGMIQETHRRHARNAAEREHDATEAAFGDAPDGTALATRIQAANAYHKGAHMALPPRQRVPFRAPAKVQETKPMVSRYPRKGVTRHKRHPTEHPSDPMVKKRNSRVPYHEQQELFRQASVARRASDVQDAVEEAALDGVESGLLAEHLDEIDDQGGQPANNDDAPVAEVVEAKTNDDPSDNDVNQNDDVPPALENGDGEVEIPGAAEAAEERQEDLKDLAEQSGTPPPATEE